MPLVPSFIARLFKKAPVKQTVLNEGEVPEQRKMLFGYEEYLGLEPTWSLTVGSQRDKRRLFFARSLSIYFSSFLYDRTLLPDILVDTDDCVLLDPQKMLEEEEYLELAVRNAEGKVDFIKVIYRKKYLRVEKRDLVDFLRRTTFNPVNRPYELKADQIIPRQFEPPVSLSRLYTSAGAISWATLRLDAKRSIPVTRLRFENLTPKERDYLMWQVADRRHFGNHRIWRFWGTVIESEKAVSLILEDLSFGPVTEFVSSMQRSNVELLSISIGITEACRYLERHSFIHRALSLDAFLLTHDLQVKLAVFCFNPCTLFPLANEYLDVDHCRYVPWECLPHKNGTLGTPYDVNSMVYSIGNCLWSLYHSGMLPFENETADQIGCRAYREKASLTINDNVMPEEISSIVRTRCWRSPEHRYTFERMLSKLKNEKGNTERESNRSLRSPNRDPDNDD